MIVCAMVLRWQLWQVDFVMEHTQSPIECDMYMKLQADIEVKGGMAETHILKLLKNLDGGRQAGKVWVEYLAEKLIEADFQQSHVDKCVWYKGDVLLFCYVDDGIWISMGGGDIDDEIRLPLCKGLKIEEQSHPDDYVGVNIAKTNDGQYVFA